VVIAWSLSASDAGVARSRPGHGGYDAGMTSTYPNRCREYAEAGTLAAERLFVSE